MKNRKGFTLIELLAVIIILGILMIIAIPSVTSYINNSRKSAYVDIAKEIVSGARNLVNEGKLEMFDTGTTYYIPVSCITTENGQKSPYGDFVEDQAFVVVTYTGSNYNYYWISRDTTGQGVKTITPIGELDEDDIKSDISASEIAPTEPAESGKTTIKVLSKDGCNQFEKEKSKICRRVTQESDLHTKTCARSINGCGAVEGNGNKITFGNLWDGISSLSSGDALDCDLNGNGTYDERFYYVTNYENNDNEVVAVLIYDKNMNDQSTFAYDSNNESYHGPRTAYEQLPSMIEWSNDQIIAPGTRQIKNQNGESKIGNKQIDNFEYVGKVARLLTYQEVQEACGNGSVSNTGYLDNCSYLLDNIGKYFGSNGSKGYWLETPLYSQNTEMYHVVYSTMSLSRTIGNYSANDSDNYGVRPVIEVLKSNIAN